MDNFYTMNCYEINKKIEAFYQDLVDKLHDRFYHHHFRIESYMKSQERPQSLNNLGLKFLIIQPLVLNNDMWIKDKNWQWSDENTNLVSKICTDVSSVFGFEFVEINTNWDNIPLFIIKVATDNID